MKKIHFIAIGGSIMHQLAIALKEKGDQITGSDDDFYDPARSNLKQAGLLPEPGWDASRITSELDGIVLGMHARSGNEELEKAQELNLPLFSFPEYIYEESKDKMRVVVGGSHGKTTITSMIMHVLRKAGKDFDFLVGAPIPGFDHSVKISDAPIIVCEGDEYPASAIKKEPKFLFYHPQIAVLSGIAWDHMNVFPTFEVYKEQFGRFIEGLADKTTLIYNAEDEQLQTLVDQYGSHLSAIPYQAPAARIQQGTTFLNLAGQEVPLRVFGRHNLMNILAAYQVCTLLGVTDQAFLKAIQSFEGASLRLEKVHEEGEAVFYRDFAHAPSKVRASVSAVKNQFPNRKLVAVLELHTYSSLNPEFLPQYAHALDPADEACVFYSKHAMEVKKMAPLAPQVIKDSFANQKLKIAHSSSEIKAFIERNRSERVNLLMMSSGSFDGLSNKEIQELWWKK